MSAAWLLTAAFGLCVGSFLGLVAHRLPIMLERRHAAWLAGSAADDQGHFDLLRPASHCPACGHRLGISENIPLLSWLLQSGRCRACGSPIGWREPLVELGAALLALLAVWRFGPGSDAALAATCLWLLLLASVIDIQRGWLPAEITTPLLWLGLLASLGTGFALPHDAILGAVAGHVSLWTVRRGFQWATGREGMGTGDPHLLAAIGAWIGWQALPGVITLSAGLGLLWAAAACLAFGRSSADPMPFGPMLSLAGAVALLWPQLFTELLPSRMAL